MTFCVYVVMLSILHNVTIRLWTCAALYSDPMGKRPIMMCGNLLSWMSLLKCGHKEQLSGRTEMYIHTIEE